MNKQKNVNGKNEDNKTKELKEEEKTKKEEEKTKKEEDIIKTLKIYSKEEEKICDVLKNVLKSDSLKDIRSKISKLKENFLFYDNEDIIEVEVEDSYEVESIIKDGKVFIKKTGNSSKNEHSSTSKPKIENKPIEGSKLIEKKEFLEFYLYPSSKYSPEEEANSKSMMVVGQTGCGKTTLLNSLVNYLTGIRFEDKFRYKIINEGTNQNQAQSQTSEVNIYYIHSHNGNPPIKIIDTPGFGDTRGIEMDKLITKK